MHAGKTVQQTLSEPAQIRKAEREVAAFRQFQQLSSELVELNEQVCQLRPPQAQDLDASPNVPKKLCAPSMTPSKPRSAACCE